MYHIIILIVSCFLICVGNFLASIRFSLAFSHLPRSNLSAWNILGRFLIRPLYVSDSDAATSKVSAELHSRMYK